MKKIILLLVAMSMFANVFAYDERIGIPQTSAANIKIQHLSNYHSNSSLKNYVLISQTGDSIYRYILDIEQNPGLFAILGTAIKAGRSITVYYNNDDGIGSRKFVTSIILHEE